MRFQRPHLLLLALLLAQPSLANDALQSSFDVQDKSNTQARTSQQRVDELSGEARQAAAEYRTVQGQVENARLYNQQLEKLVQSQKREMLSLEKQLQDINVTQREIVPLMLRMLDTLEKFVALDMPFLPDERHNRLKNLRVLMDRADVTVAEKYRRLMEAYQVETEYGRTIEAYRGELDGQSGHRTVDFLRLGRVGLYYQTLDGKETGQWNRNVRQWEPLSDDYRAAVGEGLRMARKQAAPDLLVVPVPAAERVQ